MRILSWPSACLAALLLLAAPLDALAQQDPASLRPAVSGVKTYTADLTGAAEVPGPGDADGSGRALVIVHRDRGTVCFRLQIARIDRPTAAHIHEGAAGAAGGPVVNLDLSGNRLSGCTENVDRALLERIRENPAGFYVNVHNADHPGGAVRGQLKD